MARANSLVYGKIQIHSQDASLSDLQQILNSVMEKHGYPESVDDAESVQKAVEDALKEAKQEEELAKARAEFEKMSDDTADVKGVIEEIPLEVPPMAKVVAKKPWEKKHHG